MTTTVRQESESSSEYKVVGTRPIRHDGYEKVTGAAKYGADIQMPSLLHGKILRSPYAHARIRGIDTSKAEALPGVTAVLTSKDFPIIGDQIIDLTETQGNIRLMAEHVMAHEKALYKGHAVAAVSATSAHIAEAAVKLIEVDYEVLPTVLTLHDALKEDAPLLHENMTTMFKVERFGRGEDTGVQSNVAGHIQHKLGDPGEGIQRSRRNIGAGVPHPDGPPGVHRTSRRHRVLGHRRPPYHLDMHPGRLCHPRLHGSHYRPPRVHG